MIFLPKACRKLDKTDVNGKVITEVYCRHCDEVYVEFENAYDSRANLRSKAKSLQYLVDHERKCGNKGDLKAEIVEGTH